MTIRQSLLGTAIALAGLVLASTLAVPAMSDESAASDAALAATGASVFAQRCKGCHAAEAGQPSYGGPNLAGVVGRTAGSGAYRYSTAMKNSGLVWTGEEIDAFIAAPMSRLPGTYMAVSLADAGQRKAVVAYLATTTGEQPPQP